MGFLNSISHTLSSSSGHSFLGMSPGFWLMFSVVLFIGVMIPND